MEFDENWDDWKPGDKIVWEDDKNGEIFVIEHIARNYVWWRDKNTGKQSMTRDTNLLRVVGQ